MAARKKSTSTGAASFFNKDLFIFIVIMALVAFVTYVLTYNAITSKLDKEIGGSTFFETSSVQVQPEE